MSRIQCDYYSQKAVTPTGLKDLYLLVFLHVGTRRVFVAPSPIIRMSDSRCKERLGGLPKSYSHKAAQAQFTTQRRSH